MNAPALEQFLHSHIPASRALGIRVTAASAEEVRLLAPFAANRNHHQSVFGGSGALLATLCGWSLVHLRLPEAAGKIVIQESSMRYLQPARSDLEAVCRVDAADEAAWQHCRQLFAERGKGRINVACDLYSDGVLAVQFQGKYVALA